MTLEDALRALAGPAGALVAVVIGIIILAKAFMILWREHLKADEEDRAQRDKAELREDETKELLRQSLSNNADTIVAWNRRNELEATRQRRGDGR